MIKINILSQKIKEMMERAKTYGFVTEPMPEFYKKTELFDKYLEEGAKFSIDDDKEMLKFVLDNNKLFIKIVGDDLSNYFKICWKIPVLVQPILKKNEENWI